MPVQVVSTTYSAVATGTTVLPYDDTIPQSGEGDQYMTQAITPTSVTNKLIIRATGHFASSTTAQRITAALFQDSTANAIAVSNNVPDTTVAGLIVPTVVYHSMVAGTTSATTFKIRAGANNAGTTTFNGDSGTRKFGGISFSYIEVMEIAV